MNPHPTTRAFRPRARSVRCLRRDAQARKMESMGSLHSALDITSRKGQGTVVKLRFPRIPPAG